jgi:hypothetical protein
LVVVSKINTTERSIIYIREVKIERDGDQYGPFYQAVHSYRVQGKIKQDVVHLGQHKTAEAALGSWPKEIKELKNTRPTKAKKLQEKLDRLRKLNRRTDTKETPIYTTKYTTVHHESESWHHKVQGNAYSDK